MIKRICGESQVSYVCFFWQVKKKPLLEDAVEKVSNKCSKVRIEVVPCHQLLPCKTYCYNM